MGVDLISSRVHQALTKWEMIGRDHNESLLVLKAVWETVQFTQWCHQSFRAKISPKKHLFSMIWWQRPLSAWGTWTLVYLTKPIMKLIYLTAVKWNAWTAHVNYCPPAKHGIRSESASTWCSGGHLVVHSFRLVMSYFWKFIVRFECAEMTDQSSLQIQNTTSAIVVWPTLSP